MRKPITIAIVFMIAFTLTITGQPLSNPKASKPVELPENLEAANAVARLGDLTRPVLRETLKRMRPPAYLPDQDFLHKIVAAYGLPLVSNQRTAQLKATLQPVLAYHQREQMSILVVASDQPKANLVDCLAIVITTKLMSMSSEAEIRGIVAHELAHEYVWDDGIKAMKAKDWKLRRECELFCDVVAAFTLKEIGDDPASYFRILQAMAIFDIRAGHYAARHESDTHPALAVRKKLNEFLCQRLD